MGSSRRVCAFVAAVVLSIAPQVPVQADSATSSVETAKAGVVQVNTVYTDDGGEKHIVCGGAGFLIGNPEGTEYVVTCNHIVNPEDEVKKSAYEFVSNPESEDDSWKQLSLSPEVVIEGDVVLNASVLTVSRELDMAVLQLPQPIYTRSPLSVLTDKGYDITSLPYSEGDTVYALGYPSEVSYNSQIKYFSDKDVEVSQGVISNLLDYDGIQVIETDADTGNRNYGGPLVTTEGYLIGMNISLKDGEYSCALDSTKITKVLDGLGIDYTTVEAAVSSSGNQVIGTNDSGNLAPLKEGKKGLAVVSIVIIVGIVVAIAVIIAVVMLIKNKKSSGRSGVSAYDIPNEDDFPIGGPASSDPTGVEAETCVLSDYVDRVDTKGMVDFEDVPNQEQFLGVLVRKSNNESIRITKNDFVIGKGTANTDYQIADNSSISRRHAMICTGRNGVYIHDCNSTNGTFINGTRIESERSVLLNSGDIIKLANEEFEYHL